MRRVTTPLLLLLLPVAVFLAFFHAAVLDPGNAGWLIRGTDNGENALGLHAYLHDKGAGASLRTALLNAPDGVPVLFTDSNPLVALATKPFASLLPADAQFVGPWMLLCLVLNAVFAWLLLRRHAPGPIALWAGVVLLAFPPTLANRFIHANLMAHWTILAALWLFLDPVRRTKSRCWAPLIAVTALIHSYLLIMIGAIWASAMMMRFVRGAGRERMAIIGQGIAIVVLVGLLAWWMGVGRQQPAGNYGVFSMPLDALWNPGLRAFSMLLPVREQTPEHGFEGFQYLGAGGLLLVAAAVAIAFRLAPRDVERETATRLRDLVPALVVLTILAIAQLPLPTAVLAMLDPVRASGRLFWPVGYVMILMAVLAVYRLPAERAGLMLVAFIVVQAVDLTGMAHAIRWQSRAADQRQLYVRTMDPRWDRLVEHSTSVAFFPTDVTKDLSLFQEVAWRAVTRGRPVTAVYAAREPLATTERLASEQAAFMRGELVPGRLYVLLPSMRLPSSVAARRHVIDGFSVIPPVSPSSPR